MTRFRIVTLCWPVLLFLPSAAIGATNAQKCEAGKLQLAGKYGFCRLKAESKAVKTGDPTEFSKCDSTFETKWNDTDAKYPADCPTLGDSIDVKDRIQAFGDSVAANLAGLRFVDNGDGTVTDTQTGLMWEQKDDAGGIHDKDNLFDFSTDPDLIPNGSAFLEFLWALNAGTGGTSVDGQAITGCFADHCDWRLPSITELQSILLEAAPCATSPCIDPVFGPTQPDVYWSATTLMVPIGVWVVNFDDGEVMDNDSDFYFVRAVRGGL